MINLSTISQQSTTMEKYLQQTKVMADLNSDDPKHSLSYSHTGTRIDTLPADWAK